MPSKPNDYPWKTIIFAVTIIAIALSPTGQEIYRDCKSFYKKHHDEQKEEDITSQKNSLLQKFSNVKTSKEIRLASLPNQKIKISYKATKSDELSIIFNISPYTSHRADNGFIIIEFMDVDNFLLYSFDVPENRITQIVDADGVVVGGRYESLVNIDLNKLEQLNSIRAKTNLTERRLSQLSGQFDEDQRKNRQELKDRVVAYKKKLEPENLVEYKIQSGDTLYRLARRHGVKQSDILRINEGISSRSIKVGDSILLPKQ